MADKIIYSFLGGPGAGKGVLAYKCKELLDCNVFSIGSLSRKHIFLKTELGNQFKKYLDENKLIPDDWVVDLVLDWLLLNISNDNKLILDGFPRTILQAQLFLTYLSKICLDFNFKVIDFIVKNETLLNRLHNRFICANEDCQKVYDATENEQLNGYCLYCGEKITKRIDDEDCVIINKRINKYPLYKDKLLKFYRTNEISIIELNAEGSKNSVFDEFRFKIFKK